MNQQLAKDWHNAIEYVLHNMETWSPVSDSDSLFYAIEYLKLAQRHLQHLVKELSNDPPTS